MTKRQKVNDYREHRDHRGPDSPQTTMIRQGTKERLGLKYKSRARNEDGWNMGGNKTEIPK